MACRSPDINPTLEYISCKKRNSIVYCVHVERLKRTKMKTTSTKVWSTSCSEKGVDIF